MRKIKEKHKGIKAKDIKSLYANYNVKDDQRAKIDKAIHNFMKNDSNIGGNKEYKNGMELLDTLKNNVSFNNDEDDNDECKENDANVYGIFNEILINKMNEPHNEILRKLNRVNKIDKEWEERHKGMDAKIKEINDATSDINTVQTPCIAAIFFFAFFFYFLFFLPH